MRRSFLPYLLIIFPICEIAVFVTVGGEIGVLWTIALIVTTAFIGMTLLRIQGFSTISRIRARMDAGELPGRDLVHGLMIMIAGVLLLTPGFISDTLGFLLFVPAIRERAWTFLRKRVVVVAPRSYGPGPGAGTGPRRGDGSTIDLDDEEFSRHRDRADHGQAGHEPDPPRLPHER